jgi:outer membrane protein OmpA-like peptidoglycan-associated protein
MPVPWSADRCARVVFLVQFIQGRRLNPATSIHRSELIMFILRASYRAMSARGIMSSVLAPLLLIGMSACASLSKKQQGAIVGGVAGGVGGGVVGNQTGSTARGAIIGAVVGGTIGAVIGHQMDQQAKELQQNIPGATVARVGEGITVTFASGLLYDFDSDVVRATAAENLRNLGASLNKYPNTDLVIVGHTDAVGTSAYNQTLSERRAVAASNFLAGQGVTTSRLRAVGRGETEAIAVNETEAGRQQNRRVEIAIVANAAARKP